MPPVPPLPLVPRRLARVLSPVLTPGRGLSQLWAGDLVGMPLPPRKMPLVLGLVLGLVPLMR